MEEDEESAAVVAEFQERSAIEVGMEFKEPVPYKEAYLEGTEVRIADLGFLEEFKREWKYHHKLSPEQLEYADRIVTVEGVGFYHGGDPLYRLEGVPGLWHEQCLRPA